MKKRILYLTMFFLGFVITTYGQSVIQVAAGNNTISTAVSSAVSGDIIELTTNGGVYTEDASLAITSKVLTFRAAKGLTAAPIWKCVSTAANNPIFSVGGTMNLTLNGIVFDSSSVNSSPRFINILSVTSGVLKLTNCTLRNFTYGFYGSTNASVDSLLINNCVLSDFSNRCMYFPAGTVDPGIVKYISISNSTLKNMKATEPCIYLYSKSSPTVSPVLRLNHVTFYNTQRIRTQASVTDVEIKNTIFATDGTISSGQSFNVYGGAVKNSLIFNAPVSGTGATYTNFQDNVNPLFTDAAVGNFTLTPASPALNAADDGTSLGDPRWFPVASNVHQVEAGTDKISAALSTASEGDIIELKTDGGLYKESKTLVIDKKVTIKAAASLSGKPVVTTDDGDYIVHAKAGLTLNGIQFDGLKGALKNVGGLVTDATGYNLTVTNCDFKNFVNTDSMSNHAIFSDRYTSQVDSLVISGCTFDNIKDQGIYLGGHLMSSIGSVKYFNVKNSTFTNITNDAIYVRDNDGALATQGPAFTVDHCTFYNAAGTYGVLAHYIDSTVIKNCIAAYPASAAKNAFYIYGANSILKNSIYYNLTVNIHTAQSQSVASVDPLFINAAAGNFQLYKNSSAVNAGDDGTTLGDPRWGVSTQSSNFMVFIKKPYCNTPTDSTIRVVWETPEGAPVGSVVEFGTTKALGTKVTGPDGWNIAGEGNIHEVLISGLQPFTKYYYRVGNGSGVDTDTNTFKTAPAPGTNFRLIGLSDIHDNHKGIWEHMTNRIVEQNPDMTFFIGDYINEGNYRTEWDGGFFTPGRPVLSKISTLPWIGNHETYAGSPMTFYDYFSFPKHPDNGEDVLRDPSGEAYFSTLYGDVKIICMNANDDDYSPKFATGTPQYTWLENEISTSTSKWIFIISHVNVISSGYHGQWSGSQKEYLLPLYEKYAALGKHIVVLGGDEHSFEHLYKAGVNYVRPGCSNASQYGQCNAADMPYSILFYNGPGFSTFDISENGNVVTLSARDTTGAVFYSAVLDARKSALLPSFYFTAPGRINDTVSYNYKIQWTDWVDAKDSASTKASLYYTKDSTAEGTLIAGNIKLTDTENSYNWVVKDLPVGTYFIYAVVSGDSISPIKRFANSKVVVVADNVPPPAVTSMTGNYTGGKIHLSWVNPTRTVHTEIKLGTFETGIENFVGENDGTSTGSVAQISDGYSGNALRINYSITVAWDQYSGVKKLSGYPDYSATPTLDFWYRGDGSNNALRLVAKQDIDRNGTSDDWWYNESLNLSSTAWKHAQINLATFSSFSWHTNAKSTLDMTNMYSLDFVVPCATAGSGHADIDEIMVTGDVQPAPDFQGVVVVRKTDTFPTSPTDGTIVYQGSAESCVDSTLEANKFYYYAAFAYDYKPNYSILDSTSVWKSGLTTGLLNEGKIPVKFNLGQNYPNPFNPSTSIKFDVPKSGMVDIVVYNLVGEKVKTLIHEIKEPGYYSVEFNAGNRLPSGIYFCRMQSGNYVSIKKMMLMK